MADFLNIYVLPTAIMVAEILAVVVPLLVCIAFLTLAERKVIAAMQLRKRMAAINPVFGRVDEAPAPAAFGAFGTPGQVAATPFASPIKNFYMTDPISRVSETMAKCTALFGAPAGKTGTHG